MLSQGSIPEVKENEVGYALEERRSKLSQFLDLGPPDLITLIKYLPSSSSHQGSTNAANHLSSTNSSNKDQSDATGPNSNENTPPISNEPSSIVTELHAHDKLKGEIGTFFYSLGVDTSDPTAITIFLKKIADLITENPQTWFGKRKNFQIARISLSTWNTFRKCDVNVMVHIPGTVQTFMLDYNGEQLQIEHSSQIDLIWAETFISGVVRSITLMKDNSEEGEIQNLVETLIIDPLTSGQLGDVTNTFIDLFPLVYERGNLLGGPCYASNVTNINNYLVETLSTIVNLTQSINKCREMLEKLVEKYPEAIVILVRLLFENDLEIDAINLVHEQLEIVERQSEKYNNQQVVNYISALLCVEAEFLLNIKKDFKYAQLIAQKAVNYSPNEFKPWYLLTKAYARLNDPENALVTLNACPMALLREKYTLKRVVPFPSDDSLHLPLPVDAVLDEVTSLNSIDIQNEHKSSDPTLINLPAGNLKSTYQLAYKLLTEIVQLTGWELLLKIRTKLFVMEEEYQGSINENIDSTSNEQDNETRNSTSTTAITTDLLRSKRLCERWLDNLFMLLYEDLKTYTLWQTEQIYFEAQRTKYIKSTVEWEAFGLCARRLGHYPEAAVAFEKGLSQRFSSKSAQQLMNYCVNERQRIINQSNLPNCDMTSSQIVSKISELDSTIIDLCVKTCCWNHRWYIEFSLNLFNALSPVVFDMGLTKLSNEIAARYSESVFRLVRENLLDFFEKYTNDHYDS
ncbi:exomer complex subunit NDAI_0E00640 [Naumovozyma dairenensis CBS 421]|uniref:Bud site selection protein 7 n=1 Tax=Naumovozyma dairenensis (strain ATCC 10597 / BCRC 20456 / CBS 421 / NBRC 0211 / NRRL Y-12639) TaxID=1071378 RepID=G0WAW0_NAUDC|nr:hypothetical protein NDAI_0E00640 [Naumovozyma dairenensis CBS 421]CCD24880.1 hypothetical protein NDAI_0E00640 [Naumovozyma dairenensis CBS 421]